MGRKPKPSLSQQQREIAEGIIRKLLEHKIIRLSEEPRKVALAPIAAGPRLILSSEETALCRWLAR